MKRNKNDFNFSLSNVLDEETEMFPLMSNEDEEQIKSFLFLGTLFLFSFQNLSQFQE